MKDKIALAGNLFIGVMTVVAFAQMIVNPSGGLLMVNGLHNLKFFTVLSNVFNGIVAFAYLFWVLRGKEMTEARTTVKLMANAAVGLTFVTVMGMLGPLYGYSNMFNGSNLWFHLVLPLASWLSFGFFEQGSLIPLKRTLWAVLPPALYAMGYLGNIAVNGIGEWPASNDFYGFLLWGNGVAAVIACGMALAAWLIALALRWVRRAARRS